LGRVSFCLDFISIHSHYFASEDEDEPMDQDNLSTQEPAKAKGELSEYNLDDYDNDDHGISGVHSAMKRHPHF
jgi:hypothetical protein